MKFFRKKGIAIALSLMMSMTAVTGVHADGNIGLKELKGSDRYETAISVSKAGWPNGSKVVVMVNSKDTLSGIVATPLASSNGAPVLITHGDKLDSNISKELTRLNPDRIIVLNNGGNISAKTIEAMHKATGADIQTCEGKDAAELSVNVAKEIKKKNSGAETAYIVSATNGVADALSISAKAGESKEPVLVVTKNSVSGAVSGFLKENMKNAYYIGGPNSISENVIKKISSVVKNAGSNHRISGADRYETNSKIVNTFYKNRNFKNLIVTRADNQGLIDTVAAGPYAAKYTSPIVITKKTALLPATANLLKSLSAESVTEIGGGIEKAVGNRIVSSLKNYVSKDQSNSPGPVITPPKDDVAKAESGSIIGSGIKGKTIVIDAGHGGKDNGASGLYGVKEKNWTLKTATACADYLKAAGAKVIMTRSSDTYPTLPERADISNDNNAALFCSIHYNQGGDVVNASTGELSGTGVEVFKGEYNDANVTAKNILNSILQKFPLRNRGVKDGTHLYVIRNTEAPAILVEGGFLTNSKDVSLLNNDTALKNMGIQIAKGIIATFNGQQIK